MIDLRHVSKTYGKKDSKFSALNDLSFSIPDNKTVAVVGKSGSGKSTLLHLLGGLDRPTEGEIVINDLNLTKLSNKEMDKYRSNQLGFVFQSFFVEANLSCYENVALPLEISKVASKKRRSIIEAALEKVDLTDKLKSKARTLSGGQKQRLAIARALVNKPKVILTDEPTGNLDSITGDKVIELLFNIYREQRSTLVIVTHDKDIAQKCDIKIYIRDGEIERIESRSDQDK